jgi:alpha-D-xyloside xylohydrolase
METTAIHDGYVRDWGESRRMFALPRSSYAGMQRTGASMWSGDISGTWDSMRRSVAGSINYQLAGNALWSMDTGGYFHALDELTNNDYRELLVRWHQFASFTPVLRQHGRKGAQTTPAGGSEYYLFGGKTTAAIKAAHQVRKRHFSSVFILK